MAELKFFEPVFTAPLESLPDAVDFGALPDPALAARVSYDAEEKRSRFSGIMTAEEKTALDNLSADPLYRNAVNSLFNQVRGALESRVSLADLAVKANPLRGAVKPGTEPGLEATAYFGPEMGATASGAHALIVEVDPETFDVDILRYVVVHDCGTLINPLIVEGQVHGGVAQGIGNAFYEELAYDSDTGQLLNASFMDYLLPTSTTVPHIEVGHEETPSPLNPMGVKGAGAIPVGPAFAQAVEDALADVVDLEILEIPLSPNRLFELVQSAAGK